MDYITIIKAEEIQDELINLEYDYKDNIIPYKEYRRMKAVLQSELDLLNYND